jgi:hypothetical protein
MRARRISKRGATPLACTLSLALLAASAAPGRSQTASPPTPAATAQATAQTRTPAKTPAPTTTAQTTGAKTLPAPVSASAPKTTTTGTATASVSTPKTATTGTATAAVAGAPAKTVAAKKSVRSDSTTAVTTSATPRKKTGAAARSATPDSSQAGYTLRGGQEGTVFKSLTVEGEDRVHVDFERPALDLELDLEKAPGLDWGSAVDVLNRSNTDLQTPLATLSAKQAVPYLGRPWLSEFADGPVARFHPQAQGVERWKLVVVDSKGGPVATFAGKGDPPREITWDGRASNGAFVTPGLTYSYVFEAYDKAGNKRNVVGQGFSVTAYRIDSAEGPTLLFSATELRSPAVAPGASVAPGTAEPPAPLILLEAASWLNQSERISQTIRVTATARSQELADLLAGNVRRALAPLVIGDPARVEAVALVEPDSPEAGTLSIAAAK